MNTDYKIQETDIGGEIRNFPIEVVKKMVEYQVKQGNEPDVKVFRDFRIADAIRGGFDWNKTEEGIGFWREVISFKNFEVFFKRYPKSTMEQIRRGYEKFKKIEAAGKNMMNERLVELLKGTDEEAPLEVLIDENEINIWMDGDKVKFDFDGKECELDDVSIHELFKILETIDEK